MIVPLWRRAWPSAGCAKKYVSREVGEVNQKVDDVSAEVEKTQQRVQQNEVRIDERGQAVADRHRRGQGLGAQAA